LTYLFRSGKIAPAICKVSRRPAGVTPLPNYGGRDVGIPAATATMSGPFCDRFAVFGPDSPLLVTSLPNPGGIRDGSLARGCKASGGVIAGIAPFSPNSPLSVTPLPFHGGAAVTPRSSSHRGTGDDRVARDPTVPAPVGRIRVRLLPCRTTVVAKVAIERRPARIEMSLKTQVAATSGSG